MRHDITRQALCLLHEIGRIRRCRHQDEIAGASVILTREPSPVDVIAIEPCRVLVWRIETVQQLLETRPKVRSAIQGVLNLDLARKVRDLASR